MSLKFTSQHFECCTRDQVHIKAQKIFDTWLIEQTVVYGFQDNRLGYILNSEAIDLPIENKLTSGGDK